MLKQCRPAFVAVRLHFRSEDAWAIVLDSTGAIARSDKGELLMRFGKAEARALAASMSAEAATDGAEWPFTRRSAAKPS